MKTFYENAEMEVVAFENEDVITTSGGIGDLVWWHGRGVRWAHER